MPPWFPRNFKTLKTYSHIFFDLDRTLWDLDRNSTETLTELYDKYKLSSLGMPDISTFIFDYNQYNDILWERYRKGTIDRKTIRALRFKQTFSKYGYRNDKLATQFGEEYIAEAPKKNNLLPFAKELLDYLKNKNYSLHIITNGFEEVQSVKVKSAGIESYFEHVVTSDKAGYLKPDKRVFEYSLNLVSSQPSDSLMIGDCLQADIIGAREAGMDQVYLNPAKKSHSESVTHDIHCLSELIKLL